VGKRAKKMYRKAKYVETQLRINQSVEGETLEMKVKRIMTNGEPVSDTAPIIYTDRKDGVNPAYNIRTDRFETALEAADLNNKVRIARREGKMKVVVDENVDGVKTIQGTNSDDKTNHAVSE
jgi:hypothetical protein